MRIEDPTVQGIYTTRQVVNDDGTRAGFALSLTREGWELYRTAKEDRFTRGWEWLCGVHGRDDADMIAAIERVRGAA